MNLYIETKVSPHHSEATVAGLIDPITKDRDVDLLKELFRDRNVNLITKIAVALDYEDQWIWKGDMRRIYLVKQGYKLMMGTIDNVAHSFNAWTPLWHLKIPPKYLNFVWRCARDFLPVRYTVRYTLIGRGFYLDTTCPLCNSAPKTMKHLFLECVQVLAIWTDQFSTYIQLL